MVSAVGFSPDGSIALTGSSDRMARLWDVATGRPLGPPLRHQTIILAAAFSPDGKCALTVDGDGTARRWDIDDLPDDLPRLSAWVEVMSGLAIDERGRIRSPFDCRMALTPRDPGPPGRAVRSRRRP